MVSPDAPRPRLLFLVTEDWYFWSHRLPIARAARDAGLDVIVAARITDHGERIAGEGFRVYPLSWRRRGAGVLGELQALRQIWQLYRKTRPDIVHHIAIKPVVFGSLVARLLGQQRVINSINGLGFVFTADGWRTRMLRAGLRILFRLGVDQAKSVLMLQNEDDRRVLTDNRFITRAKTAIIPGSGIDIDHYRPLPEPADNVLTIAVVTRMLAIKGVSTVVAASRLLHARGLRHRLLLAGAPDLDNPTSVREETLRGWAQEPGVTWLGRVDDVRAIWAQAHIAVLASLGGEGLPKTLLEASACGRPIVATDVPGCREIARSGVNALLVAPNNPEKLADAITTLAADTALRRSFGAAGRRLVEEEFSSMRIGDATLKLYKQLLKLA